MSFFHFRNLSSFRTGHTLFKLTSFNISYIEDGLRRRQLVRLVSLNKVQPHICDYSPVRLNALLKRAITFFKLTSFINALLELAILYLN